MEKPIDKNKSIEYLMKLFEENRKTLEYQIESMKVDVTEDISQIMQDQKISHKEMAKRLKISVKEWHDFLKAEKPMNLDLLCAVAWELGYVFRVNFIPKELR